MDVFWQFVCDHRHAIIEFTLLICVLLVTLFKKKVKVNKVFELVLLALPVFINEAEASGQVGSEKFAMVFNRCIELLECVTHKSKKELLDEYTAPINASIENILSTPQKKER